MINSIFSMRRLGKDMAKLIYDLGMSRSLSGEKDRCMDKEDMEVFIDSLHEELKVRYNIDGAGDIEEQYQLREMFYQPGGINEKDLQH